MSNQVAVEIIEAPPVSVEVVEDGGVQVVEIDQPTQVETVEIITPGRQGPAAASAEIRIDASAVGIVIVGRAPGGSAESAPTWTITRTTYSPAGIRTGKATATGVTWTGRASHSYT